VAAGLPTPGVAQPGQLTSTPPTDRRRIPGRRGRAHCNWTRPGTHEGVAPMSQATRARTHPHLPHVTLNTDGRRHPLENILALFTLAAGIVAFALGFVVSQHVLASWIGLAGLAVGLYAQMISATRAERMVIVAGLVAAFVGFALGLGHGAFFS